MKSRSSSWVIDWCSYDRTSGFLTAAQPVAQSQKFWFFVHSVQSVRCVLMRSDTFGTYIFIWLAYFWYTRNFGSPLSFIFPWKNPCFSGVFCERAEIRTLNQWLKRKRRMRFFVLLWVQPVFIVFSVLFFLYFGGFLGSTLHLVQSVLHMLTCLAYLIRPYNVL